MQFTIPDCTISSSIMKFDDIVDDAAAALIFDEDENEGDGETTCDR